METIFNVPGIHCEGCAATIKKAAGDVPGVSTVDVDVASKTVRVGFDDTEQREKVSEALATAGYPPADAQAQAQASHGVHSLPVVTIGGDGQNGPSSEAKGASEKDPVCGMTVDPARAAGSSHFEGATYYFCSASCKRKFDPDPKSYLEPRTQSKVGPPKKEPAAGAGVKYTCPMHPEIVRDGPGACPICGMALEPMTATADGRGEPRTGRHEPAVLGLPRR